MKANRLVAATLALTMAVSPLAVNAVETQELYAENIAIQTSVSSLGGLTVMHKGEELGGDSVISTNDVIIKDGTEYIAVVKGDVNGDGKINSTDFMQARKEFLGLFELEGASKKAADVDGDTIINSTDCMRIRRHFLDLFAITVEGDIVFGEATEPPVDDKTYAPLEYGMGNTLLDGLEIKDQNGDGVIHIGCIGDSITAGNPGKCYPDYLQEYLNELSKIDGNTYVVHNNGKGGAGVGNTEEQVGDPNWGWSTVIDEDGDGYAYFYYDDIAYRSAFDYVHDVTIVQMGTNNWADGNLKNHFAEDYYNWLIKPFQDMGSQVVISTAPYAYEEGFNNAINRTVHDEIVQMAWDLELPIVDMNRLTYGMDEIYDGIHPFPAGYSVMALIFYEQIFGGTANRVDVTAVPGTEVTFVDGQGRTFNRTVPESGNVVMMLSPATTTYNVFAECDGYMAYKTQLTVDGDMELIVEFEEGENVAYKATPFACDVPVYQGTKPHDETCINDGDMATGYQPSAFNDGDYVGLEFDQAYDVSVINIYWETAAYISSFADGGFEVWFKVDGEWVQQTDIVVPRESYTGDIVCDVITLDPAQTIEGVQVVIKSGTIADHKFAPKLYELEVFA